MPIQLQLIHMKQLTMHRQLLLMLINNRTINLTVIILLNSQHITNNLIPTPNLSHTNLTQILLTSNIKHITNLNPPIQLNHTLATRSTNLQWVNT
jgi:hypothetical protein